MTFEQIYQAYFRRVYLYLVGLTGQESLAEELTAETFFRAMECLDRFRGDCAVQTWLCQIAKNCYFSYLRRTRPTLPMEEDLPSPNEIPMEERLADRETAMDIHRLAHKLPEPYREVFLLRALGDLSFRDIGALFEKSENWACVTYHRARKKIRSEMEESL